MDPSRFEELASRFAGLRVAIVGDFCLDRYLEIDPSRQETSIETGLPVHNVVEVRSQPGGAGTILNNLAALGTERLYPVGFCGHDGEGTELRGALLARPGVQMGHFVSTPERRTFTYCKPLVREAGKPPVELSRFDFKNWTPTPANVETEIIERIESLILHIDAMVILDQVDVPETGVVTRRVLEAIGALARANPKLLFIADSRRGLKDFPPVCFKMNRAELGALTGGQSDGSLGWARERAATLATTNRRSVFVTLSEEGILGASPDGAVEHAPSLPIRGPIDIVGAGDAVTANLTAALAAGAAIGEAIQIAMAAASVVIHQLGTTGTASVAQIRELLRQG